MQSLARPHGPAVPSLEDPPRNPLFRNRLYPNSHLSLIPLIFPLVNFTFIPTMRRKKHSSRPHGTRVVWGVFLFPALSQRDSFGKRLGYNNSVPSGRSKSQSYFPYFPSFHSFPVSVIRSPFSFFTILEPSNPRPLDPLIS